MASRSSLALHCHNQRPSPLLSLPLELRNIIYYYLTQDSILTISPATRKFYIIDAAAHKININNKCCAYHRPAASPSSSSIAFSTFASLVLTCHQISAESRLITLHATLSPLILSAPTLSALSDFELHHSEYSPSALRDFALTSTRTVRIKAPPAWQACPLPDVGVMKAMRRLEVDVTSNLYDLGILRVALGWIGWRREVERSEAGKSRDSGIWVFVKEDI